MGQKTNATLAKKVLSLGIGTVLSGMRNKPEHFIADRAFGTPLDTGMRRGEPLKLDDGTVLGNEFIIQRVADDQFLDADAADAFKRSAKGTMKKGANPLYDPVTGRVEERSHYIEGATVDLASVRGASASAINLGAAVSRHDLGYEKDVAYFARNAAWSETIVPALKWDAAGADPFQDMGRAAEKVGATRAIFSHEAFQLLKYHKDTNSDRSITTVLSDAEAQSTLFDKTSISELLIGSVRHKVAGAYKRLWDSVSAGDRPWVLLLADSGLVIPNRNLINFAVGECGAKIIREDIPATPGAHASHRHGKYIMESKPDILSRSSVTSIGVAYTIQLMNGQAGVLLAELDTP